MSLFKRVLGLLSFTDLFKYKFFFRIGKSIENSTFFSVFVSLLVITPLLVYFLLIADNTIKHSEAKINVQEYDVNQRPYLNLNKENFRLAFRIIFPNTQVFTEDIEQYFDFYLTYNTASQNNSQFTVGRSTSFQLEPCYQENFLDFSEYYNLNLINAYCLANHSMEVGGFWDEETIGWFEFGMVTCGSMWNKTNCKSSDMVQQDLKDSFFYVFIESQDVDASNYENPLKNSMKTYSVIIDFKTRKEIFFFMQNVQLNTYDSLVYNTNPSVRYFNKHYDVQNDYVQRDINDTCIIRIRIFTSNKVQTIDRIYMTLIEAAAVVGGISTFFFIFGRIITFIYNDMKLKIKLINSLYSFDLNNEKLSEKNDKKKDSIKLFSSEKQKINLKKLFTNQHFDLSSLRTKLKKVSEDEIVPDKILENYNQNFEEIEKNNLRKKSEQNQFKNSFNDKSIIAKEINKSIKIEISALINNEKSQENINEFTSIIPLENSRNLGENEKKTTFPKKVTISNSTQKLNTDEEILKNSKLKFSTWETIFCMIMPICCLRGKIKLKYSLYQKASEYLMKYIDIFSLIKMVDDMQKLKSVLLTNQQLALFNYISKPTIKLSDNAKKEKPENYINNLEQLNSIANFNNNVEIIQEIRNYYEELKKEKNWTIIDVRLFDYLDENLKNSLKLA